MFYYAEINCKIEVISCSEAYYNYMKSITKYGMSLGNPFSQPVQVYSNINNGFGIFAGGNIYQQIVKL